MPVATHWRITSHKCNSARRVVAVEVVGEGEFEKMGKGKAESALFRLFT